MKTLGVFILIVILGVVSLSYYLKYSVPAKSQPSPTSLPKTIDKKTTMQITSSAFQPNTSIPQEYSCEGKSINPPLSFSNVPMDAKSMVLLMDDPDVPKSLKPDGMFDHWVIFNMPPEIKELTPGMIPPGVQGKNGAGQNSYTGPCPPDREHRYFFKLYALDQMLDLDQSASKSDVEKAMQGHILAQAELIGLYDKKNK